MQVSFRIDAASYASFLNYTRVVVRNDGSDGTVVVTCDAAEVDFKAHEEVKTAYTAQRKR